MKKVIVILVLIAAAWLVYRSGMRGTPARLSGQTAVKTFVETIVFNRSGSLDSIAMERARAKAPEIRRMVERSSQGPPSRVEITGVNKSEKDSQITCSVFGRSGGTIGQVVCILEKTSGYSKITDVWVIQE